VSGKVAAASGGTEESIREFCNAVHLGQEPRPSFAGPYLRTGDEKIQVTGLPSLAERWAPYLLREPIACRVTAVHDGDTADVDRGRDDGLLPGMCLVAGRIFPQFRVEKAEAKSATIKAEARLREPLWVDQVLSTRARW
jgi:hypothetical protein